jgi:hypothetical protein
MIDTLVADVPRRGLVLLLLVLAALVAAPLLVNDYLLTVLILILYFAYAGQAWNIMMGFAGQLSLGHALYVGLGAYTAAALFFHFGVSPWISLPLALAVSGLVGAIMGLLAFRFGVAGVHSPSSPSPSPSLPASASTTGPGSAAPPGCSFRSPTTHRTTCGRCAAARACSTT